MALMSRWFQMLEAHPRVNLVREWLFHLPLQLYAWRGQMRNFVIKHKPWSVEILFFGGGVTVGSSWGVGQVLVSRAGPGNHFVLVYHRITACP